MANRLTNRLFAEGMAAVGRIDEESRTGPIVPEYVLDAIACVAGITAARSDGSDAAVALLKANTAMMKNLYRIGFNAGCKHTRLELKARGE